MGRKTMSSEELPSNIQVAEWLCNLSQNKVPCGQSNSRPVRSSTTNRPVFRHKPPPRDRSSPPLNNVRRQPGRKWKIHLQTPKAFGIYYQDDEMSLQDTERQTDLTLAGSCTKEISQGVQGEDQLSKLHPGSKCDEGSVDTPCRTVIDHNTGNTGTTNVVVTGKVAGSSPTSKSHRRLSDDSTEKSSSDKSTVSHNAVQCVQTISNDLPSKDGASAVSQFGLSPSTSSDSGVSHGAADSAWDEQACSNHTPKESRAQAAPKPCALLSTSDAHTNCKLLEVQNDIVSTAATSAGDTDMSCHTEEGEMATPLALKSTSAQQYDDMLTSTGTLQTMFCKPIHSVDHFIEQIRGPGGKGEAVTAPLGQVSSPTSPEPAITVSSPGHATVTSKDRGLQRLSLSDVCGCGNAQTTATHQRPLTSANAARRPISVRVYSDAESHAGDTGVRQFANVNQHSQFQQTSRLKHPRGRQNQTRTGRNIRTHPGSQSRGFVHPSCPQWQMRPRYGSSSRLSALRRNPNEMFNHPAINHPKLLWHRFGNVKRSSAPPSSTANNMTPRPSTRPMLTAPPTLYHPASAFATSGASTQRSGTAEEQCRIDDQMKSFPSYDNAESQQNEESNVHPDDCDTDNDSSVPGNDDRSTNSVPPSPGPPPALIPDLMKMDDI